MTQFGNRKKGILEDELRQADRELGQQMFIENSIKGLLYLAMGVMVLLLAVIWGYWYFFMR